MPRIFRLYIICLGSALTGAMLYDWLDQDIFIHLIVIVIFAYTLDTNASVRRAERKEPK